MADTKLSAQKREGTGKGVARKLRQAGRVPAVVYGRDAETTHISVDEHEADLLFRAISVENTIVSLEVEGEKEPFDTLVREIQAHPWKDTLVHIDFLRIQKGVAVDVEVPVHLVGTPIGVKNSGGVLEQIIHELPVKCIPSMIPETIEIDVSHLDVNESLHVYDLPLEEGVEITIEGKRTICAVAIPKAAEAPAEGEELEEGAEAPMAGGGADGGEDAGEDAGGDE